MQKLNGGVTYPRSTDCVVVHVLLPGSPQFLVHSIVVVQSLTLI